MTPTRWHYSRPCPAASARLASLFRLRVASGSPQRRVAVAASAGGISSPKWARGKRVRRRPVFGAVPAYTGPMANRHLDRVLRPDYLDGIDEWPIEEIRERRAECQRLEDAVSYLRRLVQTRIDILGMESRSRFRWPTAGSRLAHFPAAHDSRRRRKAPAGRPFPVRRT